MNTTRQRFVELCQRIGAKDNQTIGRTINSTYDRLVTAYAESDRYYHNLNHISDGLEKLDEVRHLADNPDVLEMAWWWHDVIYDTTSNINEEASAAVANNVLKTLGLSDNLLSHIELRIHIMQLILATKHIHIPEAEDSRLIVDIDLVSLATPPEVFDQNTANIRKEYSWVPDDSFRIGRAEFFSKLLTSRPSIYLTDYFRNRYEAQARENLKRITATLTK